MRWVVHYSTGLIHIFCVYLSLSTTFSFGSFAYFWNILLVTSKVCFKFLIFANIKGSTSLSSLELCSSCQLSSISQKALQERYLFWREDVRSKNYWLAPELYMKSTGNHALISIVWKDARHFHDHSDTKSIFPNSQRDANSNWLDMKLIMLGQNISKNSFN